MDSEASVSSSSTSSSGIISSPSPQTPVSRSSVSAKKRENRKSTTPTTPTFLSNLGRATLRGIRKCPQCGVYNGTRGLSCKNKACGVSLRSVPSVSRSSKKGAVEVVKVITDSEERCVKDQEGGGGVLDGALSGGAQVFSVCHRGRGATATQWGFVELVPTDTAIATGDGATLLTRINLGRCFLPSCRQGERSNQSDLATAKQSSDSLCVHIRQAVECQSCATPLTLKSSSLEGLRVSIQVREELWRLATESPGPLVQRVSKNTLVVKCHTDSHHPLGLLHLSVGAAGLPDSQKNERSVFHCACQVNATRNKPDVDGAGGSAICPSPPSCGTSQPCLHFYACVCAFTSNEKLASEFAAFINYSSSGVQQNVSSGGTISEKPLQQSEPNNSHHKAKKLRLDDSAPAACGSVTSSLCQAPSVAFSSAGGREGVSASGLRKTSQRKAAGSGGLKAAGSVQFVDERTVTMGFHPWLASVTERIHQTMHYQFDGKPEPLVYHIPQEFFNALQQRLSLGSKKRRLPNLTTAFVRNDGLPLGSFSKYTWHVTNLLHVKRIFDTPECHKRQFVQQPLLELESQELQRAKKGTLLDHDYATSPPAGALDEAAEIIQDLEAKLESAAIPSSTMISQYCASDAQIRFYAKLPSLPLEFTQSFVKNVDGSYSPFLCPDPPPEPELLDKTDRPQPIRPMELRTFLRVGPSSADQEAGPFVIEWIPDVLPRCQMGELRISFEFGHRQSGQPESSERAMEKKARSKSDCPQTKAVDPVDGLQMVL